VILAALDALFGAGSSLIFDFHGTGAPLGSFRLTAIALNDNVIANFEPM
jgi:hypothetical protein